MYIYVLLFFNYLSIKYCFLYDYVRLRNLMNLTTFSKKRNAYALMHIRKHIYFPQEKSLLQQKYFLFLDLRILWLLFLIFVIIDLIQPMRNEITIKIYSENGFKTAGLCKIYIRSLSICIGLVLFFVALMLLNIL